MTEAKWLKSSYPSDMLLWLPSERESERKVQLLLVAVASSDDYSPSVQAIIDGLRQQAEGLITCVELDRIYRSAGVESGAPRKFTAENARYSIATSKPARLHASSLIRDIFGNPFRLASCEASWRTSNVVAMAKTFYKTQDFSPMPILADALQDAGCENEDILNHCRSGGPHVRGCWVVDLILGKE